MTVSVPVHSDTAMRGTTDVSSTSETGLSGIFAAILSGLIHQEARAGNEPPNVSAPVAMPPSSTEGAAAGPATNVVEAAESPADAVALVGPPIEPAPPHGAFQKRGIRAHDRSDKPGESDSPISAAGTSQLTDDAQASAAMRPGDVVLPQAVMCADNAARTLDPVSSDDIAGAGGVRGMEAEDPGETEQDEKTVATAMTTSDGQILNADTVVTTGGAAAAREPAVEDVTQPGQPRVKPITSGVVLTALARTPQRPEVHDNSQPDVLMPAPTLGTPISVLPSEPESGQPRPVHSHAPAASVSRPDQVTHLDHVEQETTPAPASANEIGQGNRPADATANLSSISARVESFQDVAASPRLAAPTAPTIASAPPSHQVALVLVGMLKSADGTQSVTVQLQPSELGHVQIRVDRTSEGIAHVDITTDKPETLALLQRDQPRLEQVLDQIGMLPASRSVSFQMATSEQVGPSGSQSSHMAAGSSDPGQGQNGGSWREPSDSSDNSRGRQEAEQQRTRAPWFRDGLDITA